jgi:hypothetical protein
LLQFLIVSSPCMFKINHMTDLQKCVFILELDVVTNS